MLLLNVLFGHHVRNKQGVRWSIQEQYDMRQGQSGVLLGFVREHQNVGGQRIDGQGLLKVSIAESAPSQYGHGLRSNVDHHVR